MSTLILDGVVEEAMDGRSTLQQHCAAICFGEDLLVYAPPV